MKCTNEAFKKQNFDGASMRNFRHAPTTPAVNRNFDGASMKVDGVGRATAIGLDQRAWAGFSPRYYLTADVGEATPRLVVGRLRRLQLSSQSMVRQPPSPWVPWIACPATISRGARTQVTK